MMKYKLMEKQTLPVSVDKIRRIKVIKNPNRGGGMAGGVCIVKEYHERKGKLVKNPWFNFYLKNKGSGAMTEFYVKKLSPKHLKQPQKEGKPIAQVTKNTEKR